MSPLWRGFAGMVAVFLLAFFVTRMERAIEAEVALIASDPVAAATADFEAGAIAFYEAWLHRYDAKGNPIGYWFVPGGNELSEDVLQAYPERIQLETTDGLQLTEERDRANRKARIWASAYNRQLALLLREAKAERPASMDR